MARATFEGPILSGDTRFGQFRNVGYTDLVQGVTLDLTNTTVNTANYSGASTQFVTSNAILNGNGTLYTPSSTTLPSSSTVQTPTADAATALYRGAVFYVPVGCQLLDFLIDVSILPGVSGASGTQPTFTNVAFYVNNQFVTSATAGTPYAATAGLTAVGRAALSTFTGTNIVNQSSTPIDIIQANGQPALSQIVLTAKITGTNLTSLSGTQTITAPVIAGTAGTFTCTSNANLNIGQRVQISGTNSGAGTVTNGTYYVSSITGGVGTVTGFTLVSGSAINGSAIATTAGTPTGLTFTILDGLVGRFDASFRYAQPDNNIGNATTYPYGNLD